MLCKEKAEMLLRDNIASPLYRFPVTAYQVSYPVLLADGAVAEAEVLTLGRFFEQVHDINRGLDNAAQAKMANDAPNIATEYQRNLLKARKLVEGNSAEPSFFVPAKDIVDKKISLSWWRYTRDG